MWDIFYVLFGISLGFVISNFVEWHIHKYVLHHLGKRKNSYWRAHWSRHHKMSRKNQFLDKDYQDPWWKNLNRRSEVYGLTAIVVLSFPVFILFSYFNIILGISYYVTVIGYVFLYYYVHKKSHLDFEWAEKWLPWHVDHHLGKDQEKNWNVVFPLWDYILGTREKNPRA